jgi:hypothetical protein
LTDKPYFDVPVKCANNRLIAWAANLISTAIGCAAMFSISA